MRMPRQELGQRGQRWGQHAIRTWPNQARGIARRGAFGVGLGAIIRNPVGAVIGLLALDFGLNRLLFDPKAQGAPCCNPGLQTPRTRARPQAGTTGSA